MKDKSRRTSPYRTPVRIYNNEIHELVKHLSIVLKISYQEALDEVLDYFAMGYVLGSDTAKQIVYDYVTGR